MKLTLVIGLVILTQLSIPLVCGKKGAGVAKLIGRILAKFPVPHSSFSSSSFYPTRSQSSFHDSGANSRPFDWNTPTYSPLSPESQIDSDFIHEFGSSSFGLSASDLPSGCYNFKPTYRVHGSSGYSRAPVSHYNPRVGTFAHAHTVFIQPEQSLSPGWGEFVKQAAVNSVVDTSVKASVNRKIPLRVHYHPYRGNGVSNAPVTNNKLQASSTKQSNDYNYGDVAVVNQTATPIANGISTPVEELKYYSPSGRTVFKHEITKLTERLLRKDHNNAYKKNYITIKLQEMIVDDDVTDNSVYNLLTVKNPTPEDLIGGSILDINAVIEMGDKIMAQPYNFSDMNLEAWDIPTIKALLPLHDNYIMDVTSNELITEQQRNEENEFIDAILNTTVMNNTKKFLTRKGFVNDDTLAFKNKLKTMWFTRFGRAAGVSGSSGFEYVFLAEKIDNEIIGLHNWIYYAKKEEDRQLNYLGSIGHVSLDDKGVFVKVRSRLNGIVSNATTFFVGLSPELEMSLYTLCFYISPGYPCPIKLAGYEFEILVERHRTALGDVLASADTEFSVPPTSSRKHHRQHE